MQVKYISSPAPLLNGYLYLLGRHTSKPIISEEMLRQKIEYIHDNPVRIGVVEKAEDWLYSSARNYLDLESMMEMMR